MKIPTCPAHGRLVLDLALGRLDDDPAMQAEAVRASCPHCRAWWQEELEGKAAQRVDRTVEHAFADFVPSRQHATRWMALAASLVAALALVVVWRTTNSPRITSRPVVAVETTAPAPKPAAAPAAQEGLLAASNFESGDLGRWQKVSAPPAPAAPPSRALFADSLEDGSLKGWTAVNRG